MFKAAVGHSIDPDSESAIQEVLAQCEQALEGDYPNAGILIAASDFEHDLIIDKIRQTYPELLLIGGSSVGEVSSAMGFQEDSLALMLFCSDEVDFQVGVGKRANGDEHAAAKTAIAQASLSHTASEIKLCYVLCDGISVDAVALTNGLRQATDSQVPIVGGLTADDWQFKATYQFISTPEKTEILQNALVVLTFFGNLKVSYSVASGQRPIGPKGTVTKSIGKTVYEIDGQPARNFYTSTLGVSDVMLAGGGGWSGALAVYESDSSNFYVRSPSGDAHLDGSISYFGHVPEQAVIQLVETDNNNILASVKEACQTALSAYSSNPTDDLSTDNSETSPTVALIISCASRLKALGTRTEQELTLTAECLDKGTPLLGLYSFGEIGPFALQTTPHFHNETFVALLLGTR